MVSHLRSGLVVACVYACYMYLHWCALPNLYQEPGELESAFIIARIQFFPSVRHPVSCLTHLLASLLLTYLCYHLVITSLRLQFGIGMSPSSPTSTSPSTTTSTIRRALVKTLSLSPTKVMTPITTTTSIQKSIVLTPRARDMTYTPSSPPSSSRQRCYSGAGVSATRMFPLTSSPVRRHSRARIASRHHMPICSRIAPVTTSTSTSIITSPVLPFGTLRSLATSTATTTTTLTKPMSPLLSPSPSVSHGKLSTLRELSTSTTTTTTVHVTPTPLFPPSIMSMLSLQWLTDGFDWNIASTIPTPPDVTEERAQQLRTQRSTHHTCCTSFRLWHLIMNILFSLGIISYLFASALSHMFDIDTLAFTRSKQIAYISILIMLASIDCVVYGLYHVGGRQGQTQRAPRPIMHVVMTIIWIVHATGAAYICAHAHPVIDHRVSLFFLFTGLFCLTLCMSVTIAAFRVRIISTSSPVKRRSISKQDITSSSTIAEGCEEEDDEDEDDDNAVIPPSSDADLRPVEDTVRDVIGPQHAILVLKPLHWCGLISIMALICNVTNLPVLSPGVICGHEVCHMLLVASMFLLWSYMYSLVLGWPDIPIEFRARKLYTVSEDVMYYAPGPHRYKHQSF